MPPIAPLQPLCTPSRVRHRIYFQLRAYIGDVLVGVLIFLLHFHRNAPFFVCVTGPGCQVMGSLLSGAPPFSLSRDPHPDDGTSRKTFSRFLQFRWNPERDDELFFTHFFARKKLELSGSAAGAISGCCQRSVIVGMG